MEERGTRSTPGSRIRSPIACRREAHCGPQAHSPIAVTCPVQVRAQGAHRALASHASLAHYKSTGGGSEHVGARARCSITEAEAQGAQMRKGRVNTPSPACTWARSMWTHRALRAHAQGACEHNEPCMCAWGVLLHTGRGPCQHVGGHKEYDRVEVRLIQTI